MAMFAERAKGISVPSIVQLASSPRPSGLAGGVRITPSVLGAVLISQAIVAGWPVVAETELHEWPGIFMFYRMVTAAVALLVFALVTGTSAVDIWHPRGTSLADVLLLGLLTAAKCYTETLGVQLLGGFVPALGATLVPLVTVGVCLASGMEQMQVLKMVGIILSVVGAMVMVVFEEITTYMYDESRHELTTWGFFLISSNILISAGYFAYQKKVLQHCEPVLLVAYSHLAAAAIACVLCLLVAPKTLDAWTLNEGTLVSLVYAAVGESSIVFTLLAWVNRAHSPTLLAASTTLEPVLVGLFSTVMLGYQTRVHDVLGACLVICGLILVVWEKFEKRKFEKNVV